MLEDARIRADELQEYSRHKLVSEAADHKRNILLGSRRMSEMMEFLRTLATAECKGVRGDGRLVG